MLIKHVVLFESKDHGWIAYSTTGRDAKRTLDVNNTHPIFYIFECDLTKQYPHTMKLKAPLNKHYNCKIINKYAECVFDEDAAYIKVSYATDEGICFEVSQPPR